MHTYKDKIISAIYLTASLHLGIMCSSKDKIDSTKLDFQIVKLTTNSLNYDKVSGRVKYIGRGKMKNLSSKTLKNYSLELNYFVIFNDDQSFFVKKTTKRQFASDDGFGESRSKLPWNPGEEKEFDIEDSLNETDVAYPCKIVVVTYFFRANDPFGYVFSEIIDKFDVTEQWTSAQKQINERRQPH